MAALPLRVLSLSGFRGGGLSLDCVYVAGYRPDPGSSRIVAGRPPLAANHDLETPCAGSATRCRAVSFVPQGKYGLLGWNSRCSFDGFRFFRSTLSRQHCISCQFFRYRLPRGVSRPQNATTWANVLARSGHVALRRLGMASPVFSCVNVRFQTIFSEQQSDSTVDYDRATRRALDVRSRSAIPSSSRCDARAWRLSLESSTYSKSAPL